MIPVNLNSIKQNLLRQVQQKNPQGYQFANYVMQNGGNVDPLVRQMLSKITPEQKQKALNTAQKYGAPDSYLSQLQNLK